MRAAHFLAPFPSQSLREKIGQGDWHACIQAWTVFVRRQLLLTDRDFATASTGEHGVAAFLTSYCRETALSSSYSPLASIELHGLVFRLAVRTLRLAQTPSALLTFQFLTDFTGTYRSSPVLKDVLHDLWRNKKLEDSSEFSRHKKTLLATSYSKASESALADTLLRISTLIEVSPDYSRFLLAGSETIETLIAVWSDASPAVRRSVVEISSSALRSLVVEPDPNPTALLDQLYEVKSTAEQDKAGRQAQFLRQLVSTSAIINVLKQRLRDSTRTRAEPLIKYLQTLDDGSLARRRRIRSGKRAQMDSFGHNALHEVAVQNVAHVSQIQELFPDLGAGFVVKLLKYHHGNVERATASLLEGSLPAELASADRSESLHTDIPAGSLATRLQPRSTTPLEPQRRNAYDDDDFDKLALPTRTLHIGKKETESPLQTSGDKVRIYSALAAFDSDDDERDDTYDIEDVGGTVDVQGYDKDPEDAVAEQHTESLYRAWKLNPTVFQRDAATRKSAARQALRSETTMTDEAMEGFALQLQRDPRRLRALETKYPDFTGEQNQLQSTKWKQYEGGAESTGEENAAGRGRGRGRGRGGHGRGRGRGNVAGATNDRETQIARQRKDENKAQRANHNRRAQRARKIGRAGFPG